MTARLQLRELCGYRAGDKGDVADVAIFADDEETYDLIAREVTAERVKQHFGAMVRGSVERSIFCWSKIIQVTCASPSKV